ncbi:hypothetical protein EC973_000458 [Apophysomyces ossiformis]|uniref:Alpha-glucosidase n=1 Tax=Apophysomyces ossiformis TaxID=679940 RepID=A0A8H7BLK5_9FUNG|nr:hypothetical protein EC973_000458 [Apophysomyces ossiformis]
MLESVLNYVGLGPIGSSIQPRLSIGPTVAERIYEIGNFRVQIDAQDQALVVQNNEGHIIWRSLHNTPFLLSTAGKDIFSTDENGYTKVVECDDHRCLLQTITRVEHKEDTLNIYGGLSTKLVLPTHLDYVFSFKALSPRQLAFRAEIIRSDPVMENHRRVLLQFASRKEEEFFGFGEQLTHTSQKGRKVHIFARNHACKPSSSILDSSYQIFANLVGTENLATDTAIAQFISTDNRCFFLENPEYASFDFTQLDRVLVRQDSGTMTGRLIDGDSILDLISEYTTFSGRMKPLPSWISQGAVAGLEGGEEKIQKVFKQLQQYKVPVAAIWIQDWCGKRVEGLGHSSQPGQTLCHWESDTKLYPHWDSLLKEFQENGVRVLLYTNLLLDNPPSSQDPQRNMLKEANENEFLVKDTYGQTLRVCADPSTETGMLDLTNPEAVVWFKQLLKDQMWNMGISGEYSLHSRPESYHNQYSADWAKLHHDLIYDLDLDEEAVNFYRSGYLTTPHYASLTWVGDQATSWSNTDGMKSAIIAMLSSGFSGFSVTHSDIGGCLSTENNLSGAHANRSRELLQRWMELAVFTAVFRTHEGMIPEKNAQFYDNEELFLHFAHTARMYASLAPYREYLMKEAYEKGWPLMRHMVMYYPDDPTVRQITYSQFLLGPWLMVAPVTSPSASFVKVYFPRETNPISWRHIWTGKYYAADGSYVAVNTPLGQPAAFVREPREDDGLLHGLLEYAHNAYSSSPPS